MGKYGFLLIGILFFSCLVALPGAHASIYRYVDREGNEHFTDSPANIPGEYRQKAEMIDERLKKDTGFMQEVRKEEEKSAVGFTERIRIFFDNRKEFLKDLLARTWIVSGVVILAFVVLFIVVGKVSSSLGYKNVGSVLRILLTFLVLVYLFHTYVKEIAREHLELKDKVLEIKKQADKRSREL
jgi:hypothetical protein